MRSIEQLIEKKEPAFPEVKRWVAAAKNRAELLPTTKERGDAALLALQVTTRSPMGAIAHECGGLVVDGGFLRIFGAGCERMEGNIARWNGHPANGLPPLLQIEGAMLVAHDVLGGFFALDGGAFGEGRGSVHYFAPDSLEWEDLEMGYTGLVQWALEGDLGRFYADYRWPGHEAEVASMSLDQGMSFFPFLWTEEGKDVTASSRKAVPMEQLFRMELEMQQQVAGAT